MSGECIIYRPFTIDETVIVSGPPDAEAQVYDAGTTYAKGAEVWRIGKTWRSAVDSITGNLGNTPDGTTTETSIVSRNLLTYSEAFDPDTVLTEYAIDVPRHEHDPTTGVCKGLLIEPAQTNLLTYSAQFDNAAWVKTDITVTQTDTGLDGTASAYTLTDGGAANARLDQNVTVAANTDTYVFWTAFKKTSGATSFPGMLLAFGGGTGVDLRAGVNTDTGVVTASPSLTTKTIDAEDYWIVSISGANNGTNTIATVRIWPAFNTDGSSGLATATAGSCVAWGAGLVTGPYAGSYIPTGATTDTRAADLLEVKPSVVADVVSATEGTLFVEATVFKTGEAQHLLNINDGASNRIQVIITATGNLAFAVVSDGVVTEAGNFLKVYSFGSKIKLAIKYSGTTVAASVDGAAVDASTAEIPLSFSRFAIGKDAGDANVAAAEFHKAIYIPRALSDAELQAATTDAAYGTAAYAAQQALLAEAVDGIYANYTDGIYAANGAQTTFALLHDFERNSIGYATANTTGWAIEGVTVTDSAITPPAGVTDVSLIAQTGTGEHYLQKMLPQDAAGAKRFTLRVQANAADEFTLSLPALGVPLVDSRIGFTVAGGVVTADATASGIITNAFAESLGGSWYRVGIDYTLPTGITDHLVRLHLGALGSYAADGSSLYIGGAQIEAVSFFDVYTKTTTANVTNTETIVAWTDLGEVDQGASVWLVGTTYALADYVVYNHRLWKSTEASNTGNTPTATATQWQDFGPTNRYKAFDENLARFSTSVTSLKWVLEFPDNAVHAVVFSPVGQSVSLTKVADATEIYDEDKNLILDGDVGYWGYFFTEPKRRFNALFDDMVSVPGETITFEITATDGDTVAVSGLHFGLGVEIGPVVTGGTGLETKGFITIDFDEFGNLVSPVRPKQQITRFATRPLLRNTAFLQSEINSYSQRPCVAFMREGDDFGLLAWGVLDDHIFEMPNIVLTELAIKIKGFPQ